VAESVVADIETSKLGEGMRQATDVLVSEIVVGSREELKWVLVLELERG
jgi:hypothetical protein